VRAVNAELLHQPRAAYLLHAERHSGFRCNVRTELYRGHALVAEAITGTCSVFNDTSLSSAEALATLVLRPDDSAEALAYMSFKSHSKEC
jgi:hypothetical protein